MNEIQMTFYSTHGLSDGSLWSGFLDEIEKLIDAKLTHLDINDPIRKKVTDLNAASAYILSISERERSRRLFGKFGKSKVEISIALFKETNSFPNSISLHFPENFGAEDHRKSSLYDIFVAGIRYLSPFYSICDLIGTIAGKRKSSGYAVDLQAELIGVFWFTYFGDRYVQFFEKARFEGLPCTSIAGIEGVILKLGNSPHAVDVARQEVEARLGPKSFVDPSLGFDKPIGKHALRFDALSKSDDYDYGDSAQN